MVSCDGPWVGFLMVNLLLVVPLGLPVLALSFHAWRRRVRWSQAAAAVLSLVGVVAWALAVLDHPGDPRWIPLLFVPPAVAWGFVLAVRDDRARHVALAAGWIPAMGGLAYAAYLRATWSCPGL